MTDKERIYSAVIKALLVHKDDWKNSFIFTHKGEYTKGNILVAMPTPISPSFGIKAKVNPIPMIPEISLIVNSMWVLLAK